MLHPRVEIYDNADGLFRAASEKIAAMLEAALRERGTASFVLTGGNTPKPFYELLAVSPYHERLDWSHIQFFWGDERCVPPDSPESNYGVAWKALISKLPVASENVHRIPGEMDDPEKAALQYEAEIRRIIPDSSPPSFDVVLLGMGEDGHTASIFPGTHWNEERWVVAIHATGRLTTNRVTMTPRLLNAARNVLFLISGAAKAKALAGVLEDPASDYPAKRIQPPSGNLTWMVDKEAASLLKKQ
jgi:6-phosphogluconolactonase